MAQTNSYLVDARQLAEMLGGKREDGKPLLSPKAAAKLMDEWGLPFIHLGRGRGRGRRWRRDLVEAAILEREIDPKDMGKPKPKAKPQDSAEHRRALAFFGLEK